MNSCCAYDTVKYVHIRDARLGVLRFCFVVLIIGYVAIIEMWALGGWLQSSSVVGVTRFSLQQPTVQDCNPSNPGCSNAFAPLSSLPYCSQYNGSVADIASYQGSVYPCEMYEATNAQIVSEKSCTIITRASVTNQTLACNSNDDTCSRTYNDVSNEYKFYTAQSEAFTILFDHAVTASKICTSHSQKGSYACSAEASRYAGRLRSDSSALCKQEYLRNNSFASFRGAEEANDTPCYVQPNRTGSNQDFFSLDVLLKAAGVDLDSCNKKGADVADPPCRTYRETGGTLLLNIYWSDFQTYHGLVGPYYYYSAQLIAGSEFKQKIPFYSSYRQTRSLLNAHGIKIAVLLGGEFHQFDSVNFLVTLTTALGLLAVAATVIDALMLYILPEKTRYYKAKYEKTEEFEAGVVSSAVAELNRLVNRDVRDEAVGISQEEGLPVDRELAGGSMNEPLLDSSSNS